MLQTARQDRRAFFQRSFGRRWNHGGTFPGFLPLNGLMGTDRSYLRMRRQAMHTDFEVVIPSCEAGRNQKTGMALLDEVDRLESMLTIWAGTSELAHVNQYAAQSPVTVSQELFSMVKLAHRIYRETSGAYDITSTPLSRCWGFFARKGRVPSKAEIEKARERTGMHHVKLDVKNHTIFFGRDGIELNPASIGKGLALDYAMRIAQRRGLYNVMLNGGYSSVLASGAPPWRLCWQIDVRNPLNPNKPLARVQLTGKGFSCSGSEVQQFTKHGKSYSHLIDPRTGRPAEGILQCAVIAPTAAEAEAYSTAFAIMDVEQSREFCKRRPQLGCVMLHASHTDNRIHRTTVNLDESQVEVLEL